MAGATSRIGAKTAVAVAIEAGTDFRPQGYATTDCGRCPRCQLRAGQTNVRSLRR